MVLRAHWAEYSQFSHDFIAAMFVYNREKRLLEICFHYHAKLYFLPLFCTPIRPSNQKSENQELTIENP